MNKYSITTTTRTSTITSKKSLFYLCYIVLTSQVATSFSYLNNNVHNSLIRTARTTIASSSTSSSSSSQLISNCNNLQTSKKFNHHQSITSLSLSNDDTSLSLSSSSSPPFPDTSKLNNALLNLAKSNKLQSAQEANDLLQQAESWYLEQIQAGKCVRQPQPRTNDEDYDDEDEEDHSDHSDDDDNDCRNSDMVVTGPVPDTYSYSTVIDAWAKNGDSDKAMELLKYMDTIELSTSSSSTKRNIKPNTITYNSVINSFCKSVQEGIIRGEEVETAPIKAEALLKVMTNDYLSGRNLNCLPDTTTYNTVLKVWSYSYRKDAGENAERLLEEMWNNHNGYYNNRRNNNSTECSNHNQDDDDKTDNRHYLDVTPDQFSYSTAISAWARSRLGAKAAREGEKLLEEMEQYRDAGYHELSPTTYCVNAVLNAWAKTKVKGSAQRAEVILKRMENLYIEGDRRELCPNTISFNTVISAYARCGEVGAERRAEKILRRMDQLSCGEKKHKFSSCKPDIISYNTVINGWSRSKNDEAPKRAEAILRHMAKQYANGLSDIQPDVVSYTSCISAWARSKNPNAKQAQALLDTMNEAYENGNHAAKPTVYTYNSVCNAWAKSRSDEAAEQVLSILKRMETLNQNGEPLVKPDIFTYTTCIDAFAKQGTKESAEMASKLLETVERRYKETGDADIKPNVRTYTSVITAISRSQLGPEKAENLLSRMEEIGKSHNDKDLVVDVVCFNAVFNAWGWSSEPRKAHRVNILYQRMLEMYASGENIDAKPDLITLNSLLNTCAFSNSKDKQDSSEAVDIAIKAYELSQSEAPLYGVPNHTTYGTMLMIFNKFLPRNELRNELMKNVFYECCSKGHLSGFVVKQMQQGLSNSSLKKLFGEAAISDGPDIVIDKRKVPPEWSRYAGGRSRPSRKQRSDHITKQQIIRPPIA